MKVQFGGRNNCDHCSGGGLYKAGGLTCQEYAARRSGPQDAAAGRQSSTATGTGRASGSGGTVGPRAFTSASADAVSELAVRLAAASAPPPSSAAMPLLLLRFRGRTHSYRSRRIGYGCVLMDAIL